MRKRPAASKASAKVAAGASKAQIAYKRHTPISTTWIRGSRTPYGLSTPSALASKPVQQCSAISRSFTSPVSLALSTCKLQLAFVVCRFVYYQIMAA